MSDLIASQIILKLASYFTAIAHTPGRLRVRVSSDIKRESENFDLKNLDQIIAQIDGIKDVKFNPIIGSVTIQYDNEILPKQLWDDLLTGKNIEITTQKINELARKIG